jgi:hypothetical protein
MPSDKHEKNLPERFVSRIPEFSSIEEEAEFWDTHDFTDFLDETTPVTINYLGSIGETLTVPLDSGELDALIRCAKEEGVSVPGLVHLWVKEHLGKKSA